MSSKISGDSDQVIADFSDQLDLSDLLIDEAQYGDSSQVDHLDGYLNFSIEDCSTQIAVNINGEFGNGGTTEHIIEIAGYDATANNSLSDVQIISNHRSLPPKHKLPQLYQQEATNARG